MKFIRVKSYSADGKTFYCEHLYAENRQDKAIERFLREYPEHRKCIIVAVDYDSETNTEHFEACKQCGCVHYW